MRLTPLTPIAVSLILFMSSCATIINGSRDPVTIHSDPSKATISVTNRKNQVVYTGTTPATFKLKSGGGFFTPAKYEVKISMEGYEDKMVTINTTFCGWYVGNVFFGGAVGLLIIDPATGAMWKIKNDFIDEKLTPRQPGTSSLQILNVNSIPAEWKANLIKIDN